MSSRQSMNGVWQQSLGRALQSQTSNISTIGTFPLYDLQTAPQQLFPPALEVSSDEIFDADKQPQLPTATQMSFYQDMEATTQPVSDVEFQMPWVPTTNTISQPETPASCQNEVTQEDWERVRPEIKRLYVEEGKTLKEVMTIMANQHSHLGTVKVYKSRIKKWKLDKNNKEGDMLFIVQKRSARKAIGNDTVFRVRGRPVTYEEVKRYFGRKRGVPEVTVCASHTPPHISYRTPSPVSMSSPSHLLHLEHLFSSITVYFDGSFSNGTWVADDGSGSCVSTLPQVSNAEPTDFSNSCDTAAILFEAGSVVQARRVLSQACSLVRPLFIQQDPNCTARMLQGLLNIVDRGLRDVAAFMLNYIGRMAIEVFSREFPHHPLGTIWSRLRTLDSDHLKLAALRSRRCILTRLEKNVGPFHKITSQNYLDLVYLSHFNDYSSSERLVRAHLEKLKESVGETDTRVATALPYLWFILLNQNKHIEVEEMAMDTLGRDGTVGLKIHAHHIAAEAQKRLGKVELAEKNLRAADQLICKMWGEKDPLGVDCLVKLESWLRQWSKETDADELLVEIERRVGRDEVDEELESKAAP